MMSSKETKTMDFVRIDFKLDGLSSGMLLMAKYIYTGKQDTVQANA